MGKAGEAANHRADNARRASRPTFWRKFRSEVRSRPLEALTALATSIGILFGVLGLSFVVWQIYEVRAQLDDDAYGRISEWLRDIDAKLFEHPNIRPYFSEGKRPPDHQPIPQELKAFAEFKLDFLDYFFTEMPHLVRNDIEYPVWKKYFADSFTDSPIMCTVLRDEQDEYGYELRYFANPLCPGVVIPSNRVTNTEFWKYFGRP
jgi:hypothetical protein